MCILWKNLAFFENRFQWAFQIYNNPFRYDPKCRLHRNSAAIAEKCTLTKRLWKPTFTANHLLLTVLALQTLRTVWNTQSCRYVYKGAFSIQNLTSEFWKIIKQSTLSGDFTLVDARTFDLNLLNFYSPLRGLLCLMKISGNCMPWK